MPKISDILKGLKVSVMVALLLILITTSGYYMCYSMYYIITGIVDIGTRVAFQAGFFLIMTMLTGLQTRKAIQATHGEGPAFNLWDIASLLSIAIGGIGVVLIALSIYDLLIGRINQSLIESPSGVIIIASAVQYWLAKSPASDQITFKNGPTAMIIFYIVFLAALVPFSGVVVYIFHPILAETWVYWVVYGLSMIVGTACFLKIIVPKKVKKLR